MIKMDAPIWLEFNSITLTPAGRLLPREKTSGVSYNVRLGDVLVVKGWNIFSNDASEHWFSQSHSEIDCRFLDVPICHRTSNGKYEEDFDPEKLFVSLLSMAIRDYCSMTNPGIRDYIEEKVSDANPETFTPPSWRGKTIAVPIDYIQINKLGTGLATDTKGYAQINLSGHLVYWDVCIFDKELSPEIGLRSDFIQDGRLKNAINTILQDPLIKHKIQTDAVRSSGQNSFVAAVGGVNINRTAPPAIEFH